jgi:hypothetical protein
MRPVDRLARLLIRIVAWLVALASGVFMIVYLYRWEWNRAMISGLFFVAAELALASTAILRRLRRIEERLDTIPSRTEPSPALPIDDGPGPFAWLADTEGESVFVPILLGVGVIISGIAWAIERLASASWSIGGDAAATRRLGRLTRVAETGLAAPWAPVNDAAAMRFRPPQQGPGRHVAVWTVTVLIVSVLLFAFVNVLADVTQNRPDPLPTGALTTYDVQVELRDGSTADRAIPITLWLSCRSHLPGREATIDGGDGGRFEITVRPSVGRNDDRRFVGCLEDVRLDRVLVDVTGSTTAGE